MPSRGGAIDRFPGRRWLLTLAVAIGGIVVTMSPVAAGILDATWTAPTSNVDGSPLTDLAGYRIYYGTSTSPCPGPFFFGTAASTSSPSPGDTVSVTLTGLSTNTLYYVSVAAVDTSGNVSDCFTPAQSAVARIDFSVNPTGATDFGSVAVGASVDRIFTVQNTGAGTVAGTVSVSAPFSIVSGSSFTLGGAGTSQTATVRFTPTAAASVTANVNFSANGATISPIVAGTGFLLDTTPPTVSITAPTSGLTYSTSVSTLTLGGTAVDDVGVTQVSWANSAGGSGTAAGTTSWSVASIALQPGTNVLTVTARDAANNAGSAQLTVTYDATPPTVNITAPAAGVTVGGTVTVTASAADNIGVAGVQFKLDGVALGAEVTSAPYSISWNTTTTSNASHSLTAFARDTAGNTTTSAAVAVTVSNATGGGTATIRFVQMNYATPQSNQSTVSVAFPSAQTTGNLNVVVVGWNDTTATVASVADSAGNAYALAVGPTVRAGQGSQSIYYATNIRGGTNTVTVRFSTAAVFVDIRLVEYSGLDPVSPLHATTAGTGSSTTSSSGSVTTTVGNVLLVAANTVATHTAGPGPGFTGRVITTPDGDIVEDRIVSTTGAYTATAPLSTSGWWIMQLVAFTPKLLAPDTTLPTVALNTPVDGAAVSGLVSVSATASDNVGIAGVQFLLDGAPLGAEVTAAPYTVVWDTSSAQPGSAHVLGAVARDVAGNTATASAGVTVAAGALLSNGSFESFTGNVASGWTLVTDGVVGFAAALDTGESGLAQEITITSPGNWGLYVYQTPALTLDHTYTWTFWYKTSGTNSIWAQITDAPVAHVVLSQALPGTNGVWTQQTLTFTYTTTLANQLRISSNAAGTFWLDEFSLQETVAPTFLSNGSFESFTGNIAAGWTLATDGVVAATTAADTGYSGLAQEITITSPGNWGLYLYQTPALTLNHTYTWTFWYKTSGTNSIWAQITDAPVAHVVLSQALPGTNGVWTQQTLTFTYTTTLANQLRISSNAAGSFWLDEFSLQENIP